MVNKEHRVWDVVHCSLIEHFRTLRRNLLTSILRISFHEDGSNGFLRNVVKFLPDCGVTSYTAVLVLGVQLLLTFTAAELFLTSVPATPHTSTQ